MAGEAPNRPPRRIEPYSALARIYDRVMSHVDYGQWARLTVELLTGGGLPQPSAGLTPHILECACGTGTLALKLAEWGYRVDACDQSPEMIAVADAKSAKLTHRPEFLVGTFSSLTAEGVYDAIICLYDSLNYLLDTTAVMDFLRRAHQSLKPNGLFLTDICTELNSRLYFAGIREDSCGEGFRYRRTMSYDEAARIQENIFHIEFDDEPGVVYEERHRQRIYPLYHIHSCLSRARFRIVGMTDGFAKGPANPESLRVHILCRRGND